MERCGVRLDGRIRIEGETIEKVINEITKTIKKELPEENQTLGGIEYILEETKKEMRGKKLKL